jgi:hypothetical protein
MYVSSLSVQENWLVYRVWRLNEKGGELIHEEAVLFTKFLQI